MENDNFPCKRLSNKVSQRAETIFGSEEFVYQAQNLHDNITVINALILYFLHSPKQIINMIREKHIGNKCELHHNLELRIPMKQ